MSTVETRPEKTSTLTLTRVARYVESFSCDGPSCPDSCCSGWPIEVDGATHAQWQTLRLHKDGPPLAAHLQPRSDEDRDAGKDARLQRTPAGDCLMLADDRLCAVHSTLGEEALPLVCHLFPRSLAQIKGETSMFLSLACPQAARLALADAQAMDMVLPRQPLAGRLPELILPAAGAANRLEEFISAAPADGIHAAGPLLADAAQRLLSAPELTVWQAWALYWQKAWGVLEAVLDNADRHAALEQLAALQLLAGASAGRLAAARLAQDNFVGQALPMPKRAATALFIAHHWARKVQARYGNALRNHPRTLVNAMTPFGAIDDDLAHPATFAACERYERGLREWFEPFDNAHPHLLKNYLRNRLAVHDFPRSGSKWFGPDLMCEQLDLDVLRVFLVGQALIKRSEFGLEDYVVLVQAFTRYVTPPMRTARLEGRQTQVPGSPGS
jgi:lysine-N-methylase